MFVNNAGSVTIFDGNLQKTLNGNYVLEYNPIHKIFSLKESPAFSLPSKFYLNFEKNAKRVLTAYDLRKNNKSVNIILGGEKGSGKTLFAKYLSAKTALPTVTVSNDYGMHDTSVTHAMADFLRRLGPIIVIFDEFEKTFFPQSQQALLTMLDGAKTIENSIVIISVNNNKALDDNFINRPSRFRYYMIFNPLTKSEISEILDLTLSADSLKHKDDCVSFLSLLNVNLDLLLTLTDEINQNYDLSFEEIITPFNAKNIFNKKVCEWEINVYFNGKLIHTNNSVDCSKLFNNAKTHNNLYDEDGFIISIPIKFAFGKSKTAKAANVTFCFDNFIETAGQTAIFEGTIQPDDYIDEAQKCRVEVKKV